MIPLDDGILKLLPDILLAAESDDYEFLNTTLNAINRRVVDFYSDYDKDWSDIKNIFKKMRHAMHCFPCNAWRYEKIEDLYKILKKSMLTEVLTGDLFTVVKYLQQNIFRTYNNGFLNEDIDLIISLKEKIQYLSELSERFKNERPDLYGSYLYLLQEGGRCSALLIKLKPHKIPKGQNKVTFKGDTINDIANQFSIFFSAFSGLIGKFNSPEGLKDNGNNGDNGEQDFSKPEDLEVMKDEAKKQRIRELLCEDWTLKRIGQHLSMTVDEIIDLMGFGENA